MKAMPDSELLRAYFEDPKELFLAEVDSIKSPEIRRFTLEVLDAADPQFWLVPSSSSGKYHPPEDQGEGGLLRHIIKAVAVAREDLRRYNFNDDEKDAALCAVLLHDICKNGIPWGENTNYTHGLIGANHIGEFKLDSPPKVKQLIVDGVRYHMGPWCQPIEEVKRSSLPQGIEQIVQNADYFASRQSMSFLPRVSIVNL